MAPFALTPLWKQRRRHFSPTRQFLGHVTGIGSNAASEAALPKLDVLSDVHMPGYDFKSPALLAGSVVHTLWHDRFTVVHGGHLA